MTLNRSGRVLLASTHKLAIAVTARLGSAPAGSATTGHATLTA